MRAPPWWCWAALALSAPWWVPLGLDWLAQRYATLHALTAADIRVAVAATCALLAALSVAAAIAAYRRRTALRPARSLAALARLDWSGFEELVAELYRRRGYHAITTPTGADGGVDIIVESVHERAIVQAKHWPGRAVGAPVVREIYALLEDFDADRAIVATSGRFSPAALRFAVSKPLELIDGEALVVAARRLRDRRGWVPEPAPAGLAPVHDTVHQAEELVCPHCNGVIHLAEK